MNPHGFTLAPSPSHPHRPPRFRLATATALLGLSFAVLTGCSDHELPTVGPHSRPSLTVVGAEYVVTTTANAGPGSLRQAIFDANAAGTAKTIAFNIPSSDAGCSAADVCTISLASTLPGITNPVGVTIDGTGQSITVSGQDAVRVLDIGFHAVATIKRLTIAHGRSFGLCVIEGSGGGICNGGNLTIIESSFSANLSFSGGAIMNNSALIVIGSTFTENASWYGPAIYAFGGSTTTSITNSTFANNGADVYGTVMANEAPVSITNSTFVGNTGQYGSIVYAYSATITLKNTILVVEAPNNNCSASGIVDGGGNLSFGDATCPGIHADPMLGPLQLNSPGTTKTFALLDGSPAIGFGVPSSCPATDQRGLPRPQMHQCDSGAYESPLGPTDDGTPPVVTPQVSGTQGTNGWYTTGNVTVSWTVTDAQSSITSAPCAPTTISTDTPGQVVSCSATSMGGTSVQSVTIKRDATPPVITLTSATPAPNAAGWNNASVTVSWSCSDAMSGPAANTATQTVTTEGQNQSATGQCADNAGNAASDARSGINIDKTGPTLAPVVSPNPIVLNGAATATPNASDMVSGLASSSCVAPATSTVGAKSLNCTATDNAGNTTTVAANYSVRYAFSGFQTIDPMPTVNVAKAGSAVPVNFGLGGSQGLAIFAAGYPASQQVSCTAGAPQADVEATASPGNSTLTYNPTTQQYSYTWKTEKGWAGTCRLLTVMLADGATYQASFKFK